VLQAAKVAQMAGLAVLTGCQQAQGNHGNKSRGMLVMVATGKLIQSQSRVDKNGVERVLPQPRTPKPEHIDRSNDWIYAELKTALPAVFDEAVAVPVLAHAS
jgi:hypothetical protein